MSAIMENETMKKFVALHEFAMVDDEIRDLVKEADTPEALAKLLENFGFIPCTSAEELGKSCWEEFLKVQEFSKNGNLSDFKMFAPFINYSAYGEACYNDIKENFSGVYWASTGVIYLF